MKHLASSPGVLEWLLGEETGKALEVVVQSHIVPGAALLAEDLLGPRSRLKRLAAPGAGFGGTAGSFLVVPARGNHIGKS